MKSSLPLNHRIIAKGLKLLQWLTSIGFFFLALTKIVLLAQYGLDPYETIVEAAGLPSFVSYYGLIAIVIELGLAGGIWVKRTFKTVLILAGLLTAAGTILSIFFIQFKLKSECGCGLLGDNEWGLLGQKMIIMLALAILFKNKINLFSQLSA